MVQFTFISITLLLLQTTLSLAILQEYPTLLLCGSEKVPIIQNCEWRADGRNSPLQNCQLDAQNRTFDVYQGDQKSIEFCTILNTKMHLQARDRYSIVTLTTENLSVEHVALFRFGSTIPSSLDGLIDFVYVYDASALITLTGVTLAEDGAAMYSVSLHTHYRPNPPQ